MYFRLCTTYDIDEGLITIYENFKSFRASNVLEDPNNDELGCIHRKYSQTVEGSHQLLLRLLNVEGASSPDDAAAAESARTHTSGIRGIELD